MMVVQVSLSTSNGGTLIYNQDRSVFYETTTTPEIRELMKGKIKAFFYAKMVGTRIQLEEKAPWLVISLTLNLYASKFTRWLRLFADYNNHRSSLLLFDLMLSKPYY
jgi:hypothetical protein